MKTRFLILLSLVLGAVGVRAQVALPELTIESGGGRNEHLELLELDVNVRFEGALVETVLELEFFNHTTRNQEGEFVLQLPEGATVTTYALEVLGKMRPGVSVEKAQARNAYETIKRQQIDPGLVEREAGNVYRTRIFPILPKKPKRVRIGYIQQLTKAEFELPLKLKRGKLKKFVCTVSGTARADIDLAIADLPEPKSKKRNQWSWDGKNIALDGALKVKATLPQVDKPQVFAERIPNGPTHFVVQGELPKDWKAKPLKKAKAVRLIWDTSLSGRRRDSKAEFEALKQYWKWLGEAKVSLHLLGMALGEAREFEIKNGGGSAIEKALKEVVYDGAADFSKIPKSDATTFLVTDGEISSPIWTHREQAQWPDLIILTSTRNAVDPSLMGIAALHLDLRRKDWFQKLTLDEIGVSVAGLPRQSWTVRRFGRQFLATGKIEGDDKKVEVHTGGDPIAIEIPEAQTSQWTFARRVWAQEQLLNLETRAVNAEILKFAIAERLASNLTSLIVLERFEDHVRYRIPPPEPDLQDRYTLAVNRASGIAHNTALGAWKEKIAWHEFDYPWLDWQLEEEVRSIGIWVNAVRTVFKDDQLPPNAMEPFEEWLPNAEKVMGAKDHLRTQKQFDEWRSAVGLRIEELGKLRSNSTKPPRDQPVHVSVRGYVRYRGVYTHESPFTLRKAVLKAGGPASWGTWSQVYLYRDASRIGYDLDSMYYRDVPLRSGDMIVMEYDEERRQRQRHWGGGDPFSGPADPFADLDSSTAGGGGGGGLQPRRTSARPEPPKAEEFNRSLRIEFVSREPQQLLTGANEEFLKTLSESDDPVARYQELLDAGRFSTATLLESARFFFKNGKPDIATRILSNLTELQANKFEATRAYAYWLADFGALDRAIETLEALAAVVPDATTRALVHYDAGQLSGQAARYLQAIESELDAPQSTALATIALTDHFRRGDEREGVKAGGRLGGFTVNTMQSDIRIVLTSVGDAVQFIIDEPSARIAPEAVADFEFNNGADLGFDDPAFVSDDSIHGGRLVSNDRVHEYQMRYGLPGTYNLVCRRPGLDTDPVTLHVTYYTNWGKEDETSKTETILLEDLDLALDGVAFGWTE